MNYLSISSDQREEMLKSIGVSDFDELIGDIDPDIRLKVPLSLDAGVDELELSRKVRALAAKNANTEQLISFAGAGCYDHYIPACIDYILRRPEFFTAYTPYQPEVSQGTLQAIFEYQSAICRLTGMQVANASMYDGATALAEAALMAVRASRSKRREIIVVDTLNPQWIEVLETYASSDLMDIQITTQDALLSSINENTAGVLLGYPDFEGSIVDLSPAIDAAHQAGALAVVAAHPMMLAILDSPGSFGADIVVGEAQCFGNPQSFGGPGLGYFASTEKLMRLMPGRIVGRTRDVEGKLGYVLTLSTREQHIKRERATSNICSNHALNALAAGAYLLNMGGDGLSQLAHTCVDKAHRLYDMLVETGLFAKTNQHDFGYEFALRYIGAKSADDLYQQLFEKGFLPGVLIGKDTFLFAVTEKRTDADLETFAEAVRDVG